jgi:hypothetical protein
VEREELLQIALDLAAIAEALDGVPLESEDMALSASKPCAFWSSRCSATSTALAKRGRRLARC